MTLIVEDGTGLATSEAFCSVAFAAQYHSDRGNAAWDAIDNQEAALRLATDYMTQEYRNRWKGRRVLITQALDWPRAGVVLEDFSGSQGRHGFGGYGLAQVAYTIVPIPVMRACAEFALRTGAAALAPDLGRPTISEKVDSIEVHYAPGARQTTRYQAMDNLLSPYLLNAGYGGKVTRG